MRKTFLIALGAAVALVGAAVAMAAVFTATGVSTTTAGFSAAKTSGSSRSCTGGDGKAFTLTHGRYTGTADFANPTSDLDGPLRIDAHTTYSTTDGRGYVEGSFRVRDDETRLTGTFTGTLTGTQLVGFLKASTRGNHARVIGSMSATFDPATGFTSGQVGSASSTAVLAVLAGPACKGKPAPKPKRVDVHGTLTINSGAVPVTVTVTSKGPTQTTCVLGTVSTAGLANGDRVHMKCEQATSSDPWLVKELKK